MMKSTVRYAEIILPLALEGTLTYQVPAEMQDIVRTGMRVVVPLGKKKLYSGIVLELHQVTPEHFNPRAILSVLDDAPLVNDVQLQFWNWIARYYMCSPGEVMHAALPQGLKLASTTRIRVNDHFHSPGKLDEAEENMLAYLEEENIGKLDELKDSPFGEDGMRLVRKLVEAGAVLTEQEMRETYRPRKIACVGLDEQYMEEKVLGSLMDSLSGSPAQVKALEEFARLSGRYEEPSEHRDVERKKLTAAGVSPGAITALIRKGIFRRYEITVSRIHHDGGTGQLSLPPPLTAVQEESLRSIREKFKEFPAVLLHGVTSSGKTEIYIHLIREQLEKGNQVLYLLPEIALTTQIIRRLKQVFGEKIGVYHSKYSDAERVEVYMNMAGMGLAEPYEIILGVRSAIFLPFRKLGMIIIDEEHENTYKQSDPAPRYHARDASLMLGLYTGAKVILGSATPSFESLYNTECKKYGLVELHERYGTAELPEIIIADIRKARKRKQMKSHFTPELIGALGETLNAGHQAILFQNRRGYSNYLHCTSCDHILRCPTCDVSLTYHKYNHEMICHYCGYKMKVPSACPECHETSLLMRGFGTEKVEDEISLLFPDAVIGRLDLDSTRSRTAFEKLIRDFEQGKVQVLVGTQLVTKGLDFENVSLVGVIDADSMLNFPDFRAFERSFQLMVQVSGRAGRREKRGKVVIQTMDPDHPVISSVLENDFQGFYLDQMAERKMFHYPPVNRLIKITLRHEIPSILDGGAVFLAGELKEIFGKRVLGPQQPFVGKTHGKYIRQILLKIEKDASFEKSKQLIAGLMEIFGRNTVYRQIKTTVDVDPV